RIQLLDPRPQLSGLIPLLVPDDDVRGTPVETKWERQRRKLPREVERTALVPLGLTFRKLRQQRADRRASLRLPVEEHALELPAPGARRPGADLLDHRLRHGRASMGQVAALPREVARRVEGRSPREPAEAADEAPRKPSGEEERLLAAHAAAHDVDARAV